MNGITMCRRFPFWPMALVWSWLILMPVNSYAVIDMKNANFAKTWNDLPAVEKTADDDSLLLGLGIKRTYNSRSLHDGLFGFGWCSDLETRLTLTPEGNVTITWCGSGLVELYVRSDFRSEDIAEVVDAIVERVREQQVSGALSLHSLIGGFTEQAWRGFAADLSNTDKRTSHAVRLGLMRAPVEGAVFHPWGEGRNSARVVFANGSFRLRKSADGPEWWFDSAGRFVEMRETAGRRVRLTYDGKSLRSVEREDGIRIDVEVGASGKALRLQRSDGREVVYRHTLVGDLEWVRSENGEVHSYQYDSLHNVVGIGYPNGKSEELIYNQHRDWVIGFRDRDGCLEKYSYTDLGGPSHYVSAVAKICGQSVVNMSSYEFTHESNELCRGCTYLRRIKMMNNGASLDAEYDQAGRPIRLAKGAEGDSAVKQAHYQYDSNGSLHIVSSTPGLEVRYTFDEASRIRRIEVRKDGRDPVIVQYNADGGEERPLTSEDSDASNLVKDAHARGRRLLKYDVEAVTPGSSPRALTSSKVFYQRFHEQRVGRDVTEGLRTLRDWANELAATEMPLAGIIVADLASEFAFEVARSEYPEGAASLLRLALDVREGVGASDTRDAFEALGEAYLNLNLFDEAEAVYGRAIRALESSGGGRTLAVVPFLDSLIRVYRRQGQYRKALEMLSRRNELVPTEDSDKEVSGLYSDLGLAHELLDVYRRSARMVHAAAGEGGAASMRQTMREVARLLNTMGLPDRAGTLIGTLVQGMDASGAQDERALADLLVAKGYYDICAGHYGRAFQALERAKEIFEKSGTMSTTLIGHFGMLWGRLGDFGKQVTAYETALRLEEEEALKEGLQGVKLADRLSNEWSSLGSAYGEVQRYDEGINLSRKALEAREAVYPSNYWGIGHSGYLLGHLYLAQGNIAAAIRTLNESVNVLEGALGLDHWRVARALRVLGEALLADGQLDEAGEILRRGLESAFRSGQGGEPWHTQYVLATLMARREQPGLAILFGKEAVNGLQGMRAGLVVMDATVQRSFISAKQNVYRSVAGWLIEEGRFPEAQQILTMLKEEELFDFVRRDQQAASREVRASYTPEEEAWRRRYEEISGSLTSLGREAEALRRKALLARLDDAEQGRQRQLEIDLSLARRYFQEYIAELEQEETRAGGERAKRIGRKNLPDLEALQPTLGVLGHGAVIVQYVVQADRLHILLTPPPPFELIARQSQVGSRELNRLVGAFHKVLQDRSLDVVPTSRELYELMIRPIEQDLRDTGATTLMMSLDGVLRYVPVAALHDGHEFLIERFTVSMFTEAARDKYAVVPTRPWRATGFGVTKAIPGFKPLPGVREELDGIIRGGPTDGTLPGVEAHVITGVLAGQVYLDERFTRKQIQEALAGGSPVLHIASHFEFRPGNEEESLLLLGDGTRLSLRDLREGAFGFGSLDLITLSACETGIGGGRDANGQELEGFGALAQRKGAKGVIATLWPVADPSTSIFMQRMYQMREEAGLTKGEALRQAQLRFLRGEPGSGAGRMHMYSHPYYWAPFILMGNWL